jgi:serine-type D-Ala-D-Ala carboxypeptidase/endopeptidase
MLLALTRCSQLVAQNVDVAKLDALSQPLFDDGWAIGAGVGMITELGATFRGYGRISENNAQRPTEKTVFEIGSISKAFTGLLLAEMATRGELDLTATVQSVLGPAMKMPKRGDHEITLVHLSTHTSGLPRLPSNLKPKNMANPYADYTEQQMAEFLAGHQLGRDPGKRFEYSNLGAGLLGQVLAKRAGTTYEQLLITRVCVPLQMTVTRITLDQQGRKRLAQGFDADGKPASNWDLPALAGAGGIRSNVEDMLKFLAANLGPRTTPLAEALSTSQTVHFKNPALVPDDVGLGWMIRRDKNAVWHDGHTGGFHAFIAFIPARHVGVVVLASGGTMYMNDWGWKILDLLQGLDVEPLPLPKTLKLDAAALAPFVGNYKLGGQTPMAITRNDASLFVQLAGQPKIRLYPESKNRFLCRTVGAAVTFDGDETGKITKLVLHQNGRDTEAPRSE